MSQRCWPQSKASNSCSSFYGGSKASGPPVCAPKARFVGRVNQGPVYVSQVNRKRSIFGQSFGSDLSTILRSVRRAEGRQPSGTGFSGGLPVDCRPKVLQGQASLEVFQLIADRKWAKDRRRGRGGTPCDRALRMSCAMKTPARERSVRKRRTWQANQ